MELDFEQKPETVLWSDSEANARLTSDICPKSWKGSQVQQYL